LHEDKHNSPRPQFAALPYRIQEGIEVLLISSRDKGRWVLPKGWPMKGRTPHGTAAREALEEAGVVGKISTKAVGSYHYRKRKKSGQELLCHVTVFPMLVERQRKTWPEMHQRRTCWFPLEEAATLVNEPELQQVIANFTQLPEAKA